MVTPRKEGVEYRNIRLKIGTYKRLEKRLLGYIQDKGDRSASFDDALNSLMDQLDELTAEFSKLTKSFKEK